MNPLELSGVQSVMQCNAIHSAMYNALCRIPLHVIMLYFFTFSVALAFCCTAVPMVPGLGGPPSHGLAPAETDFGRFGADFERSPGQVPLFR